MEEENCLTASNLGPSLALPPTRVPRALPEGAGGQDSSWNHPSLRRWMGPLWCPGNAIQYSHGHGHTCLDHGSVGVTVERQMAGELTVGLGGGLCDGGEEGDDENLQLEHGDVGVEAWCPQKGFTLAFIPFLRA